MEKDKGWFSIHRKLVDSDLWLEEPFTRGQAWVDLLALANHRRGWFTHRGVRVVVERGQVGHSMKALAVRWKWSRGKVKRFLEMLESEHQIEHQISNVTTLISIVNYHRYQEKRTAKRTPDGHQTDTNNKNNNDNNKPTPHTRARGKLSTGIKSAIEISFYPDEMTIEYALSRRLPDPTNQSTLDEFINNNLSSHWTSANWQAEYRKFLPKWKLRNEQTAPRKNQAEKMYEAICNLPDD